MIDALIRRTLLRRAVKKIADRRGVAIADDAIAALVDGLGPQPTPKKLAGSLVRRVLARASRHLVLAFAVFGHVRDAMGTFATLLLLDDYFEKVHGEGPLGAEEARTVAFVVRDALVTGKPLRRVEDV